MSVSFFSSLQAVHLSLEAQAQQFLVWFSKLREGACTCICMYFIVIPNAYRLAAEGNIADDCLELGPTRTLLPDSTADSMCMHVPYNCTREGGSICYTLIFLVLTLCVINNILLQRHQYRDFIAELPEALSMLVLKHVPSKDLLRFCCRVCYMYTY